MNRLLTAFLLVLIAASTVLAQQRVLLVNIIGEVDPAMSSYVDRSVAEAERSHSVVVLRINTFGGRLDVATHIRDAVINAKVPATIAFIDKRAISAGALIALSAQKILMSPGSTFGAATPIHETGEKASEKVVSYMRAEMRSTAELHHRNPDIAAAMVDEQLGLDSSSGVPLAKGSLLTLTNESARKAGYLDSEVTTVQGALAFAGYHNVQVTEAQQTISDEIIRFLTLPVVSSILIMIGLVGIFYTIKTGHVGMITLASVASLVLFFTAQYVTQIAPLMALIVFLVGIFLFLVELTPLPSFGVAAVLGLTGIFLGLFLALAGDMRTLTPERIRSTTGVLAVALLGFIAGMAVVIRYAPGWGMLQKFVHHTNSSNATANRNDRNVLLGRLGTALTPLRPSGTAVIDGAHVDVVTNGEFVMPGTAIEVVQIVASKVVVKPAV